MDPGTLPSTASFERSFYVGNALAGLYFGLLTYMCFHSCYLLRRAKDRDQRVNNFYILYGFVMLLLSVCDWVGNALEGQLMWIDHRLFPGGPAAYFDANATAWFSIISTAASVVQSFMNDGLLLYRCYIIWNQNQWVLVIPSMMFITSTVISIIALIQSSLPKANFLTTVMAIPWISLSSALNVVITVLIAGRILYVGRQSTQFHSQADRQRSMSQYTGIVAILVESALPLSVVGIVFSVFLARGLPYAIGLATTYGALVALAPQLIILRVAMGCSWEKETLCGKNTAPIAFGRETGSTTFNSVHMDHEA